MDDTEPSSSRRPVSIPSGEESTAFTTELRNRAVPNDHNKSRNHFIGRRQKLFLTCSRSSKQHRRLCPHVSFPSQYCSPSSVAAPPPFFSHFPLLPTTPIVAIQQLAFLTLVLTQLLLATPTTIPTVDASPVFSSSPSSFGDVYDHALAQQLQKQQRYKRLYERPQMLDVDSADDDDGLEFGRAAGGGSGMTSDGIVVVERVQLPVGKLFTFKQTHRQRIDLGDRRPEVAEIGGGVPAASVVPLGDAAAGPTTAAGKFSQGDNSPASGPEALPVWMARDSAYSNEIYGIAQPDMIGKHYYIPRGDGTFTQLEVVQEPAGDGHCQEHELTIWLEVPDQGGDDARTQGTQNTSPAYQREALISLENDLDGADYEPTDWRVLPISYLDRFRKLRNTILDLQRHHSNIGQGASGRKQLVPGLDSADQMVMVLNVSCGELSDFANEVINTLTESGRSFRVVEGVLNAKPVVAPSQSPSGPIGTGGGVTPCESCPGPDLHGDSRRSITPIICYVLVACLLVGILLAYLVQRHERRGTKLLAKNVPAPSVSGPNAGTPATGAATCAGPAIGADVSTQNAAGNVPANGDSYRSSNNRRQHGSDDEKVGLTSSS